MEAVAWIVSGLVISKHGLSMVHSERKRRVPALEYSDKIDEMSPPGGVRSLDEVAVVEDITTVSLGYRKETQDILLSESSFVTLDKGTFADTIKSCVLEWTKAIKDKMDSIQPSSNIVQN